MSLEHAILGFLHAQPQSGYDLKKNFDASVSHFWPADQSQIYRTLNRLVADGWVTVEVIHQTERPDRKVYSLTGAGRDELLRWLVSELPGSPSRSAEMIQVFFAAQLSDDQVLALFERVADGFRAGLAGYAAIPTDIEDHPGLTRSPREFYFAMLTLEIGTMQLQANLDWIEDRIARIRAGEIPPS
ncbi:MAG TPA: PadR family transcriptional regulator [Propionicimonas sp.]|nr:PadR family transcriptional regulator [Propionicimonas sp.]